MKVAFIILTMLTCFFTHNLLGNQNYLLNQKNKYVKTINENSNDITILYDIMKLWDINNYFDENPFKEVLKNLKVKNKLLDSYLDIYRHRAKLVKDIGYVDNYYLIGPFDNQGDAGFNKSYKPELDFFKKDVLKGKNQDLNWKTIKNYKKTFMNFKNFINPKVDSLGYMLIFVDIKKSGNYQIRFATNSQFEMFLNKKSIIKSENHEFLYYDKNIINVSLKKGVHTILVKLAKKHSEWGTYLRVLDENGKFDNKKIQFVLKDAYPKKFPDSKVLLNKKSINKQMESIKNKDYKFYIKRAVVESSFIPYDRKSKPYFYEKYLEKSIELAKTNLEKGEAYYFSYLLSSNKIESKHYLDKAVDYLYFPALLLKIGIDTNSGKFHKVKELIKNAEKIDKYDFDLLFLKKKFYMLLGVDYLNRIIKDYQKSLRVSKFVEFEIDKIKFSKLSNSIKVYEHNEKEFYFSLVDSKALMNLYLQNLDFKNYERLLLKKLKKSYLSFDYNTIYMTYLFSKKRYDDLLSLFEKRKELLMDSAKMLKLVAETYQVLGNKEKSIEYYEKYLVLSPNNSKIKEYIAFAKTNKKELWAQKYIEVLEKDDIKYSDYKSSDSPVEKLYEHLILKLNNDNSFNLYRKTAIAINNLESVSKFKYIPIYYLPNNEHVSNSNLKVIKENGEVEEINDYRDRFYRSKNNGAFTNHSVRGYFIPNLEKGDIIEYSYYLKNYNMYEDPFFASIYYLNSFAKNKRSTFTFLTENKKLNFNAKVKETANGKGKKYFIEFKDLKEIKSEPSSTGYTSNYKFLSVSTLNKWQELIDWYKSLLLKQDILPENVKKEVKEGVKNISKLEDKIKWVHNYLFEHTHYIGIELGLNAYKPYSATKVLERKFGDCKDKANLFNALLNEIGIESEMVLLRTNSLGQITNNFPPNPRYFNHAISYIPKLDIFVDLTADKNGLFDLPFSDQTGTGIIIKDSETLQQLPAIESKELIELIGTKKKNDLDAKITMKFKNSLSAGMRYRLENKENRKNYLQSMLKPIFHSFEIKKFTVKGLEDINSEFTLEIDILAKNFFEKNRVYKSIFIKRMLENEGLLETRKEAYKKLKLFIEERIHIKGLKVKNSETKIFKFENNNMFYSSELNDKDGFFVVNKLSWKKFSVDINSYKEFKDAVKKVVNFMQKSMLIGDK